MKTIEKEVKIEAHVVPEHIEKRNHYETADGKLFTSYDAALRHENELKASLPRVDMESIFMSASWIYVETETDVSVFKTGWEFFGVISGIDGKNAYDRVEVQPGNWYLVDFNAGEAYTRDFFVSELEAMLSKAKSLDSGISNG